MTKQIMVEKVETWWYNLSTRQKDELIAKSDNPKIVGKMQSKLLTKDIEYLYATNPVSKSSMFRYEIEANDITIISNKLYKTRGEAIKGAQLRIEQCRCIGEIVGREVTIRTTEI